MIRVWVDDEFKCMVGSFFIGEMVIFLWGDIMVVFSLSNVNIVVSLVRVLMIGIFVSIGLFSVSRLSSVFRWVLIIGEGIEEGG